jgi:hypothetical protein
MSRQKRPPATRTRNPRAAVQGTDAARKSRQTADQHKTTPKSTPKTTTTITESNDEEHEMNQTTTFTFLGSDADQWLDAAACAGLPIESFFVQAGHVIDEEVLNVCRSCPVRINCLRHAYSPALNITGGYFGGMSPGQRRELNYEQALAFCATDVPVTAPVPEPTVEEAPVIYS